MYKTSKVKILTLLALIFAPILGNELEAAEASNHWNFVVVVVDDLGQMDIAPNNPDTFYKTPNLSRLAESAMRFTNNYAANPVCSPSRYALMTGRNPTRVNATDWFHRSGGRHRQGRFAPAEIHENLPLEERTVAEVLGVGGYNTAFVGKWHLGEDEEFWPEAQGFDINVGGYWSGSPRGQRGYFSPYNNPRMEDGADGEYLTERLTDESLAILEDFSAQDNPFLLYLSFYTVHTPLAAPEETVAEYQALVDSENSNAAFKEEEQVWPYTDDPRLARQNQTHATYAAMVEHMDSNIGRLMNKLNQLGLDKNTVVIFTSDNGGLSTAEGSPTSNVPLRGGKGWIYEGGIRVPLMIKWPGVTDNGGVSAEPVTGLDVMPTIVNIAGLNQQSEIGSGFGTELEALFDGHSLAELLSTPDSDKQKSFFSTRPLYWHYPHYSNQGGMPASAVRLGEYKLIKRLEDGQAHLYNLTSDPGENQDLAAAMPDKSEQLQSLLLQWYTEVDAKFLNPNEDGVIPWRP